MNRFLAFGLWVTFLSWPRMPKKKLKICQWLFTLLFYSPLRECCWVFPAAFQGPHWNIILSSMAPALGSWGFGEMKFPPNLLLPLYSLSQLIASSVTQTRNLGVILSSSLSLVSHFQLVPNSCPLPPKCFSNWTQPRHFHVTRLVQAVYLQLHECNSLFSGSPVPLPPAHGQS